MATTGYSQMQGMWEVHHLSVDGQYVTPFVDRWVELNDNGTFVQGIGGRIEEAGTWEPTGNGTYRVVLSNGERSRLDGVKISIDGDSATFEIQDEGSLLIARLGRVNEIPLAAWDKCIGKWKDSNPESDDQLFMFFDQRFVHKVKGASTSGFWIISTTLEDLTTVEDNGKIMNWKISFPTDTTMSCISEFGDQLEFVRANQIK